MPKNNKNRSGGFISLFTERNILLVLAVTLLACVAIMISRSNEEPEIIDTSTIEQLQENKE